MGDVLFVPVDARIIFIVPIDQLAVRERELAFRYDDRGGRRLFFVRVVEAWKPITRVLILTLRPRVANVLWIRIRGLDEE